jgi:hypothetical protein
MPREIVYQYNGKAHLRDEPVFDREDKIPIPNVGQAVEKNGTHYNVRAVECSTNSEQMIRYIVDLAPIYPLEE